MRIWFKELTWAIRYILRRCIRCNVVLPTDGDTHYIICGRCRDLLQMDFAYLYD